MKRAIINGIAFLTTLILTVTVVASPLHKQGCESPLEGVQVCWEATGSDQAVAQSPYVELHFLPIARQINGQDEILTDYTRAVFRQLAPGGLAKRMIQQWQPFYHLDQAMTAGWPSNDWPMMLWISPRILRNSSAASNGVVDWDVYLIDGGAGGQLVRTLRIRVESEPKRADHSVRRGVLMGGAAAATGMLGASPLGAAGAVMATMSLSEKGAPYGKYPLELLTELATRQLIFLLQNPIEELEEAGSPSGLNPNDEPTVVKEVSGWLDSLFAAR